MLKGALIGFGRMGLTHFSLLNNHPEVQFLAVCDSSSFICRNIRKYAKLQTFTDYRKMLDKMELDFVIIATPTVAHAATIKYALQRHLHVFVEKPFGTNPQEGREVLDILHGTNLVNQVGYVLRFNDVFIQIKNLLNSGAIGDLLVFKVETNAPTILREARNSWRSKKTQGGGCLHDLASHSIDLVNYLFGVPDDITGSVMQSIHSKSVDDAVCSTFIYNGEFRGNIMVNWSSPTHRKPAYNIEILGRKGKIIADQHMYKIFFMDGVSLDGFHPGWNRRYITDFVEPVRFYVRGFEYTRQLDHFVDCIQNKVSSVVCSFEDGLKTDIVIERIATDATERKVLYG